MSCDLQDLIKMTPCQLVQLEDTQYKYEIELIACDEIKMLYLLKFNISGLTGKYFSIYNAHLLKEEFGLSSKQVKFMGFLRYVKILGL